MEKRVTSQDVADTAGVSRTTVSFVFDAKRQFSIRPETRTKVKEAAKKLGYYPNASARALASNQAKAIGLIMTRDPRYIVADSFLPQIVGGMLDVVKQEGLSLLIEWVEPGQQLETYMQLTKSKHIDGMVLLTPRFDDPGLVALEKLDIPTVIMGRIPGSKLYSVDIDNCEAANLAVNHLVELGHRQIACITNAPTTFTSAAQRLCGYFQALLDADIDPEEGLVRYADFDSASGYTQMQSLLEGPLAFSAVFVASDNVALGAINAIHDAGLNIPNDISVVGFDDIPEAVYFSPSLSSVHVPADEITKQSCSLLMQLMRGENPEERAIIIPTHFIARESTRKAGRSQSELNTRKETSSKQVKLKNKNKEKK